MDNYRIDDAHKCLSCLSSIRLSHLLRVGDDLGDVPWRRMNSQMNGGITGLS